MFPPVTVEAAIFTVLTFVYLKAAIEFPFGTSNADHVHAEAVSLTKAFTNRNPEIMCSSSI